MRHAEEKPPDTPRSPPRRREFSRVQRNSLDYGQGRGLPAASSASPKTTATPKTTAGLQPAADTTARSHTPQTTAATDDLPPRNVLMAAATEQSQLHDMASLGRVHDVESLIQAGADREKTDAFGRTPLHLAASLGHESVVRMLARLGAKLEQRDSMGQAPVHLAAHHGQKQVIGALLELRADVNGTAAAGRAPLHCAVEGVQTETCRQLVTLHADPEARDECQDTPLTLAVRTGHVLVLDALVDSRCDIHTRDEEGASPLHLAACKQRLECIEVLLRRGARVECIDKYGLTPLHWAARTGEPEAAACLVELKASIMSRTTVGTVLRQTPLHLAAMADELETIEVLVAAKASPDAQDSRGYTSLHTAVEHDRPNALSKLLQLGAQRDLQTKASDTALHLACHRDRPQIVQRLMRGGCNVNARGRNGHAALHVVAEIGSMQCAAVLLDPSNRFEQGYRDPNMQNKTVVNANSTDTQKQTPLHIAAWHGRVELCDMLVHNSAEVDVFDAEQCTPLSLAVSKDRDAAVKVLLRLQADPMRRNPQELAPLQQACVCGAINVARSLAEMKMLPKLDEPSWRRPMALAKFYQHQDIVDYFFQPCPRNRLMLNMVRAVGSNAASVTLLAVVAEPPVTSVVLQCVERPPGFVKKHPTEKSDPEGGGVFAEALQREIKEEEWLAGRTIVMSDLRENTDYLLRLRASNDAGTTFGDIVEVHTKPPEFTRSSSRRGERNASRFATTPEKQIGRAPTTPAAPTSRSPTPR